MYNVKCTLPANREPWVIPLEERHRLAVTARRQGKKLALLLYHHADTSTFRYRCYNVMQATQDSQQWQSVYFFMDELEVVRSLLSGCQVLVLTRLQWEHALDELIQRAHAAHIPVLYDVDDFVCSIQHIRLVTNTLNVHFGGAGDYDFWFAYISRQEFLAAMADGFITTNDFLGNKLQERFGKPYQVIINTLNQEQMRVSQECSCGKLRQKSRSPYLIGYFSGTPSHINDFKVVSQELIRLLEEHSDIVLEVVGFMEFPAEMNKLIRDGRVRFRPLVDFLELQQLMAEVDVSIVPLVNNTFTNCKSELKFFEAAMVDTVTLATPTYTYAHAIRDGETGFLCRPGQWYERLSELYQKPALGMEMAVKAKEYCRERYFGPQVVSEIESAYDFFCR